MLQQRKKDYLQKLIEDFFSKLHQLKDSKNISDLSEQKQILSDCFNFFSENFDFKQSDDAHLIIERINDLDLLEQYAKLLLTRYEIIDIKDIGQLYTALDIVKYLEASSITYSWDRTILKEDLLRLLNDD